MTTDQNLRPLLMTKSINFESHQERPPRSQIARANYSRRRYQYTLCGYKSPINKPYQELGEVVLDDKQLVLEALGQSKYNSDVESPTQSDDDEFHLNEEEDNKNNGSRSRSEIEKYKTIDEQLHRETKMMKRVKLGRSLFELLAKERTQMENMKLKKREKEEIEKRTRMKTPPPVDEGPESSDDDQEADLLTQEIPSNIGWVQNDASTMEALSPTRISSKDRKLSQLSVRSSVTHRSAVTSMRNSFQQNQHQKKKKRRDMPRPFSPLYTNLNLYKMDNREALFRQLCVLNWILEAMSQDNNPPVMPLVTSSWSLKDLKEDNKAQQRRMEKDQVADPTWQSFLSNSRRQSRAPRKSIWRSSFQHRSEQSSPAPSEKPDIIGRTSPSKGVENSPRVTFKATPEEEEQIDSDVIGPSTTINRWRKLRVSYQFCSSLADIVERSKKNQSVLKTTDFSKWINGMRNDFSDIQTEQATILHDHLAYHERNRQKNYEKKFHSLEVMNNLYETLKTFRENEKNSEAIDVTNSDDERIDEIQTNYETCVWYSSLIKHIPDDMKEKQNTCIVLKKLQRFCELEGRKTSANHFLRSLSILRPFELCHPDISAAIEFVRDKIVGMDTKQFEVWCKKHTKRLQQSRTESPTHH